MEIDIVIGTHNRLEMLRRTVECIRERTRTPYRLTVIDDCSDDGTAGWVQRQGIRLHRNPAQMGMHGNLAQVYGLTRSDPVICTDDDVLCPLLRPDWLARLLTALAERPKMLMLGMNNPADNRTGSRHPYADDGTVVYSRHVSGHFLAMRRALLKATPGLFKTREDTRSPNKTQAYYAATFGTRRVGYLRDVYVYHFCATSIRRPGKSWQRIMVEPVNMETLEPAEEYKQCRI